jgi:head-tail adaptor
MCLPLLFLLFENIKSDYNKLLNRYNDISKELATVSDSNSEEEVASINDMFKREMAIFLKLYRKIKVAMEEHRISLFTAL